MTESLVSVIIPTKDRQWLLRRAVKSVLNQSYKNIEIIIVNDGDESISLPTLPNIKIISGHANSHATLGYGSGGFTRNLGLQKSSGDYIMFLDDDDIFLKDKVSVQLQFMKHSGYRASCTDAYIGISPYFVPFMANKFSKFYENFHQKIFFQKFIEKLPQLIDEDLLNSHNFVITSTAAFERSLLIEAGGFKNIKNGGQLIDGIVDFEDWETWRRVVKITPFGYLNLPLVYYKRGSLKKLLKKILARINNV